MIDYGVDADGIAVVEWNLPSRSQNVINPGSMAAWVAAMDRALADPAVRGILVTSAKKDFIAGGDLDVLAAMQSAQDVLDWTLGVQAATRRFETAGKPIAAAMPGSALGGGLEIALCCHYRVVT